MAIERALKEVPYLRLVPPAPAVPMVSVVRTFSALAAGGVASLGSWPVG